MSHNRIDETGNKYGLLTVVKYAYTKNKRAYWVCNCDCGNKNIIVQGKYLRNGDTKSCGCLYINNATNMGKSNKKVNDYYIDEFNTVHVKLQNNKEMLCDLEDWEKAKNIRWYENNTGYARGRYNGKTVLFHNFIFNIQDDKEVDHIYGNRLDNRKSMLRILTRQENNLNKGMYINNKSGVTGVRWNKQTKKWHAYIQYKKKYINLGYYENFEEAVLARKNAELEYFNIYNRRNLQ